MAENPLHRPDTEPEPARQESPESNIVCESWQQMIQSVLGVLMLIGALALVHYYAPLTVQGMPPDDLQDPNDGPVVTAHS